MQIAAWGSGLVSVWIVASVKRAVAFSSGRDDMMMVRPEATISASGRQLIL